jgi:hypothetical protein
MLAACAATSLLCLPAAASPFDGTWKADMSTAKLPKKPFHFQVVKGIYQCFSCVPAITIKADGQDHAVSGHPYWDMLSITLVDDHTFKQVSKKAGKVVMEATHTVSADGRTMVNEYTDSSATNAAPVTGKSTLVRVSAGPRGSAAVSGSWRETSESDSDNGLTVTYKVDGDMLTMSTPTGQSFAAKLDGTETPYKGDPGTTSVMVKKLGPATIEETDKRNGKVVGLVKTTISADGKVASITYTDKLRGATMSFKANKV